MESVLVLGVGNEILTDDGIGPRLVNSLNRGLLPEVVDYKNTSLGGLEMLDLICRYESVVLIDAMKTGIFPPGSVHCFTPDDFRETLHLSNLHDINFLTALELGRVTGMPVPANIYIIAIEIVEDMVFSSEFSPAIQKQYPEILRQVEDMLKYLVGKSPG
jgi:hydrogenase maturation protease